MPIPYLRNLTANERTPQGNRHLAQVLIFIAGAINAGGFFAVQQYTSHMSGIVSGMADNLALGDLRIVLSGVGALLSFVLGAACSEVLINLGRQLHLRSQYACPLVLEAGLLIVFGLLGSNVGKHQWLFVPMTVSLLCFVMGLQNAMISKLSKAEIRTTHVTGMVTDIGIELGKLVYLNVDPTQPQVFADRKKLSMLVTLVGLFLVGGVVGAFGFKYIGFGSTLPLAGMLVVLTIVPVVDEVRLRWRQGGMKIPD
jgi:uncharacterized membrane protein YoaK (UPF0700 family)